MTRSSDSTVQSPFLQSAHSTTPNEGNGDGAPASSDVGPSDRIKSGKNKKSKPIREESFPAELVFERNDFNTDKIVDPNRKKRRGPKGYTPSSLLMALLLMYLKSIKSVLALIRFLNNDRRWVRILNLKRNMGRAEPYSVPDRTRFCRFAKRVGIDAMTETLSVMVVRLMKSRVIKAKCVSLDAPIISAWFKDCRTKKGI